ncbi:hypothetical protein [Cohnella zeiphila]|uniref:Uncharacterized protein n=1 Tax=Cohnella zeiphila TaxID=2761120 RepID=A0A7X0VYW3_9BACL|nr:hypothetical protein [Cohnella zeiphila]MBB6735411.1 hypothetical protein [Cohnella zeiphila]
MNDKLDLRDKKLREAQLQFLFPFSLEANGQRKMRDVLLGEGYDAFRLDELALERRYYGKRRVSHREMESYYLPFTSHILYPDDDNPECFQRLSKALNAEAELASPSARWRFAIHSTDVVLTPFDTGFLTLRVGLSGEGLSLTQAVEFAKRFRVLQHPAGEQPEDRVVYEGRTYDQVESFLFEALVPRTMPFLDRSSMNDTYFEKLPLLIDERMYVIALYLFDEQEDISLIDRYRATRLDGMDEEGKPYVSASHLPYIRGYCRDTGYDRWAPDTFYLADESSFCCLTRAPDKLADRLAGKMYGEYYYGLLLNLFHRIVLLKLSTSYSKVQLERNPEETALLIRSITAFSAKYYFLEVASQSQGREIFLQLRRMYGNDELFEDVKQTLNDLFQYQENSTSKRSSYLLTVLTIYTVISGIYGMNQVIDDLKGRIRWSVVLSYSPFQWIALVVTVSGLVVAFGLTVNVLWKWAADWFRRRIRPL